MTRRWADFVARYVNDPFYWFQPKGFTVSQDNLPFIRKKLRVLCNREQGLRVAPRSGTNDLA